MNEVGLPARAYKAANAQALASGAHQILLDTVSFDPGGLIDNPHYFGGTSGNLTSSRSSNGGASTNAYIAPVDGIYLVSVQIRVTATATAQTARCEIRLNGAVYTAGAQVHSSVAADMAATVTDQIEAAAGDEISLWASSNANISISAALNSSNNFMNVQQVG